MITHFVIIQHSGKHKMPIQYNKSADALRNDLRPAPSLGVSRRRLGTGDTISQSVLHVLQKKRSVSV